MKNKLGLIIGMGTDCKSALSGLKQNKMIYKLAGKYRDDIKSFAVNNENKLLISTNNEVIDFENKIQLIESDISFQELYCKNSNFFINDLYGKGYLFTDTFEAFFLDEYIFTVRDNFVITSKRVDEERITIIRNVEDETEKYEIKGSSTIYFIAATKFFRKNFEDNSIECYSFPKCNLLWQFPFSSFENSDKKSYEARQILGEFKEIVWVFLYSGEFIGLDVCTGQLKHRIIKNDMLNSHNSFSSDEVIPFFDCQYHLDEEKGKIVGLAINFFYEIDLNKEEPLVMTNDFFKQYELNSIYKQNIHYESILDKNLLFFRLTNQLKFCVLDVLKKEILYVSEAIDATISEYDTQQIKDMQVSNDKVYLLDSGGTLHIFEKDE
jgi:hypothetical protein